MQFQTLYRGCAIAVFLFLFLFDANAQEKGKKTEKIVPEKIELSEEEKKKAGDLLKKAIKDVDTKKIELSEEEKKKAGDLLKKAIKDVDTKKIELSEEEKKKAGDLLKKAIKNVDTKKIELSEEEKKKAADILAEIEKIKANAKARTMELSEEEKKKVADVLAEIEKVKAKAKTEKIELTEEEKKKIAEAEAEIEKIKANAKTKKIELTQEEKKKIAELQAKIKKEDNTSKTNAAGVKNKQTGKIPPKKGGVAKKNKKVKKKKKKGVRMGEEVKKEKEYTQKLNFDVSIRGGAGFNNINIDSRNRFEPSGVPQGILVSEIYALGLNIHVGERKTSLWIDVAQNIKGWQELRYGGNYTTRLSYIQSSLIADVLVIKINFGKVVIKPKILLGIYTSFLTGYTSSFKDVEATPPEVDSEFQFPRYRFDESSKTYDYGLIGGFGLSYQFKRMIFFADIRHEYGFLSLLDENSPQNPGFIQIAQTNLNFSIFYRFTKIIF